MRPKNRKMHPLYSVWREMRKRCNSPAEESYKYYGARGIRVCERWNDFWAFVEDMGPRPKGLSIDRITCGYMKKPHGRAEPLGAIAEMRARLAALEAVARAAREVVECGAGGGGVCETCLCALEAALKEAGL